MMKHIAIYRTQVSEIEGNFQTELKAYQDDAGSIGEAFGKVKKAYENSSKSKDALIKYPFMAYLFKEQPRFGDIKDKTQVDQLVTYFLKAKENAKI